MLLCGTRGGQPTSLPPPPRDSVAQYIRQRGPSGLIFRARLSKGVPVNIKRCLSIYCCCTIWKGLVEVYMTLPTPIFHRCGKTFALLWWSNRPFRTSSRIHAAALFTIDSWTETFELAAAALPTTGCLVSLVAQQHRHQHRQAHAQIAL